MIMDPAGKKNTVTCNIEDKGNSSYRCTYKPTTEGQHTIYVTFAGGQISKSPFMVTVGEGKSSLIREQLASSSPVRVSLRQLVYKLFCGAFCA